MTDLSEFRDIKFYTDSGCRVVNLGIVKMPKDFLMLQDGDGYYTWLHKSGVESVICWNKWWVYKWAKDYAKEPQK